jgi:hypothetical protein
MMGHPRLIIATRIVLNEVIEDSRGCRAQAGTRGFGQKRTG